jgi:hypothetical protein
MREAGVGQHVFVACLVDRTTANCLRLRQAAKMEDLNDE